MFLSFFAFLEPLHNPSSLKISLLWTLASTHQPALFRAWPSPEVCYPFISLFFSLFLFSLHSEFIPDRSFAPSCPTLPSVFCFYLSPLTCQRVSMSHHMCFYFLFSLPASCPCPSGGLCRGGRRRLLCHCGSFCPPISIKCSTGSFRLGRMLYGVEILKEREMMDGSLYRSLRLSTSSLPLVALMTTDHSDQRANGHCTLIIWTHTYHAVNPNKS